MSVGSRLRKGLFWGGLLTLALVAGGVGFAYFYATDNDTLRGLIAAHAPRFLPGSRVQVGRVQLQPFSGKISLKEVALWQTIDGRSFLALRLPWLQVRHDPSALLEGRFEAREVMVAQPILRICRRRDGTWNLQGLLADPLPVPDLLATPALVIEKGTVELCDESGAIKVLREVTLKVAAGTGRGPVDFEGSAAGDAAFDRVTFKGSFDPDTGRVILTRGDLHRLVISDALRDRLPAELRPPLEQLGMESGEVDLAVKSLAYDPNEPQGRTLRKELTGRLRAGVWKCTKLPFPINDLVAGIKLDDEGLTLHDVEGRNGNTVLRAGGTITLGRGGLEDAPFDLQFDVLDLMLDDRLRNWTPEPFPPLWGEYQPKGRVSLAVRAVREEPGGPVGFGMTAACHDVSMNYHLFRYPLDNINGEVTWEGDTVALKLRTRVAGQPLTAEGTILHPGDDALVDLRFRAEAFPVDETLFKALPPEILAVVEQFEPSGSVRGTARLTRRPPEKPDDPPVGLVEVHADLELHERCRMKWVGLPYPVTDLKGKLELHPDHWVFREMRGRNGLAELKGSGKVELVGRDPKGQDLLKVDLALRAEKLPFDDQLREALPPAWQKTWAILNPTGTCDFDATIRVAPGVPDYYHMVVVPGAETNVRLEFERVPKPGFDPGGPIVMRMEGVRGTFDFLNDVVTMHGVGFQFRGAPVRLETGQVTVADTGQFRLGVERMSVDQFRFDAPLRAMMPPTMAQFAELLDDGKTYTVHTDLGLSWSGKPGESVRCDWKNATVVLNGNAIQTGAAPVLLQGQIDHLAGWFDGQALEVSGGLRLDSLGMDGQQVTAVESPLVVKGGVAELSKLRGRFLGGDLTGQVRVSLDTTPDYSAQLRLRNADLRAYGLTLPLKQNYRGKLSGDINLRGQGSDLRTLQGDGWARVVEGDLGELPFLLKLFKTIKKLTPADKTAFDSAYVVARIQDGTSTLDPILLTGDAFSLQGRGTLGVNRDLDLRLHPLYGRDKLRLPFVSDAMRELSGQILIVRVQGTPDFPRFNLEALPQAGDAIRALGRRETTPRADRDRERPRR